MAIINKTGIIDAGLIQAEHVTRIIDALSGIGTDTIRTTELVNNGTITTGKLISNDYIELPGLTDDPVGVINNGTIWHRTDLNQLRVYLDGAVRIINTSAPI